MMAIVLKSVVELFDTPTGHAHETCISHTLTLKYISSAYKSITVRPTGYNVDFLFVGCIAKHL